MATTEDSSEVPEEPVDEPGEVENVIESAAERILNGKYESAYDRLATKRTESNGYAGKNNYRDPELVASKVDPEIAGFLSEVVTGEPFKGVRTLDESEQKLKEFAEDYLSDHSDI